MTQLSPLKTNEVRAILREDFTSHEIEIGIFEPPALGPLVDACRSLLPSFVKAELIDDPHWGGFVLCVTYADRERERTQLLAAELASGEGQGAAS